MARNPSLQIFQGFLIALVFVAVPAVAPAQDPSLAPDEPTGMSQAAEKLKALRDPDAVKKREQDRVRPPIEFTRTQVAPFEVLTYVKENQWASLGVETKMNYSDYSGRFQTAPVQLLGMPHAMVFRREDRLIQEQPKLLGLQVFLPRIAKELPLELTHPDAIRPDGMTSAFLMKLEPHQMLVVVLGPGAAEYNPWSRLLAFVPTAGDPDPTASERQRYYRLVQSQDPEKHMPPLAAHPLTWTAISHIIWDGQDPDSFGPAQQQSLIDWLHWGGQLIIMGGAGPSLAPLRESFLGPYLPAEPSGEDATLSAADLEAFSDAHPAPYRPIEGEVTNVPRYQGIRPETRLRPPAGKSIYLTGLTPNPGATVLPLGDSAGRILGVEGRVGRGRILMLGVRPTEKAWVDWPGLDTFVRRVVLRRPMEAHSGGGYGYAGADPTTRIGRFGVLSGPELTWSRYLARDLGAPDVSTGATDAKQGRAVGELILPTAPVTAWLDGATLPVQSRIALQEASGITIPGSDFVLKIALAYILALVPANWLLCRFVFRRRELAWVITPLLALGFAVAVERGAAYDLGFDSACDEIDLLEFQSGYPRAHVSRFGALYSTGRHSYTIRYPSKTWPLCLPMNMQNALAGSDNAQSVWQAYPDPALIDFPVQPRSLSMFRAEQLIDLPGGIHMKEGPDGVRSLVNNTDLELHDAEIIEIATGTTYNLGTIAKGGTVPLGEATPPPPKPATDEAKSATPVPPASPRPEGADWLDPRPFLNALRAYHWDRPEDKQEWRLVAWSPQPQPGQVLEPAVDRHRGVRLIVAHLDYGSTPFFDMTTGGERVVPYRQGAAP